MLTRLEPREQQQGSFGVERRSPGLEAEVKPLPRDAEQMRQQVLAAPSPQMRTDLPDQFVPERRIGAGQQRAPTLGGTTREPRRRRPARGLQGKPVETFNYFVRKRRCERRPGKKTQSIIHKDTQVVARVIRPEAIRTKSSNR